MNMPIPKFVDQPEFVDERLDNVTPGFEDAIHISEEMADPEWDRFLANTAGGHHVQTSLWAQVKASLSWKPIRVMITRHKRIVAGGQLLYRSISPMLRVGYLTKGPLCDETHPEAAQVILEQILRISQEKHLQLLAVQPANNGFPVASLLPTLGFQPSLLELAPTASIVLDLSPSLEQLMANMKRQTRQNIRRGVQAGLFVYEGSQADLKDFYQLHLATSHRQNFPPYTFGYYQNMWSAFEPIGAIGLIMARFSGEAVSALLLIPFGETVVAKILGWSGQWASLRPNDAVFWQAIVWAKTHGFRYFDFEGIDRNGASAYLQNGSLPAELQNSPDFFKLGYGGQVLFYPRAFEMISSRPLQWLYKKLAPTVGGNSPASHLFDRIRKI
jgi:lipid II:glycine glycyltransferase (peptidoglycan interpeptide bridge formation enzyme)